MPGPIELMKKFKLLSGSVEEAEIRFRSFGKTLVKTSAGMKALNTAIGAPVKAIETLNKAFDESFKRVGKLQNAIYIQSRSLGVLTGQYKTAAQSQKIFTDQIKTITEQTKLSTESAQKMQASIMAGFKGILNTGAVTEISNISSAMLNMAGSVEEAEKTFGSLYEAMHKYAGVRKALDSASKGNLSRAEVARLELMESMGHVASGYTRKTLSFNEDRAQAGGVEGRITQGREAFDINLTTTENILMAQLKIMQKNVTSGFVKGTKEGAGAIAGHMGANAGFYSMLNQAGAMLNISGNMMGSVGGGISKFGGGGGTSSLLGMAGSTLSKSGIAGGGILSTASKATATPVWVTNFGDMKGDGPDIPDLPDGLKDKLKGGKVGTAMMMIGRYLPILAGLAAAGGEFISEENKDKTFGEKATNAGIMGIGTGGTAAIGAAIGSMLLPGIGTAIGAAGGAALGYWGSKKVKGAVSPEKKDQEEEKAAEIDLSTEAQKRSISIMNDEKSKREEVMRTTQSAIDIAGTMADSFGGMGDAMKEFLGFSSLMPGVLKMQSEQTMQMVSGLQERIVLEKEFLEITRRQLAESGGEDLNLKSTIADKELQLLNLQAQVIPTYLKAQKQLLSASTVKYEMESELAQIYTESSSAARDLHTEQRLGMAVSYEDQVNVVKSLALEKNLLKQKARALMLDAQNESLDPSTRQEALIRAQKASNEATRKETEMYKEAKAMREGYLDAFKAEMSATGGYAELLPKAGSGQQNFADSMKFGSGGRFGRIQGLSDPSLKYTRGGVTGDLLGTAGISQQLLGDFDPRIMQMLAGGMDTAALAEAGMGAGGVFGGTPESLVVAKSLLSEAEEQNATIKKRPSGTSNEPIHVIGMGTVGSGVPSIKDTTIPPTADPITPEATIKDMASPPEIKELKTAAGVRFSATEEAKTIKENKDKNAEIMKKEMEEAKVKHEKEMSRYAGKEASEGDMSFVKAFEGSTPERLKDVQSQDPATRSIFMRVEKQKRREEEEARYKKEVDTITTKAQIRDKDISSMPTPAIDMIAQAKAWKQEEARAWAASAPEEPMSVSMMTPEQKKWYEAEQKRKGAIKDYENISPSHKAEMDAVRSIKTGGDAAGANQLINVLISFDGDAGEFLKASQSEKKDGVSPFSSNAGLL